MFRCDGQSLIHHSVGVSCRFHTIHIVQLSNWNSQFPQRPLFLAFRCFSGGVRGIFLFRAGLGGVSGSFVGKGGHLKPMGPARTCGTKRRKHRVLPIFLGSSPKLYGVQLAHIEPGRGGTLCCARAATRDIVQQRTTSAINSVLERSSDKNSSLAG